MKAGRAGACIILEKVGRPSHVSLLLELHQQRQQTLTEAETSHSSQSLANLSAQQDTNHTTAGSDPADQMGV